MTWILGPDQHPLTSCAPTRRAEGGAISGATAFDLWETSGFPLDLTQLMAEEDGLSVDVPGYEAAMEAAREKSRAGARDACAGWAGHSLWRGS